MARLVTLALLATLAAAPYADARPLVGIVNVKPRVVGLVKVDPDTLSRTSRPLRLRGHQWGYAYSPDGTKLAIGVSTRGRVQIVDLRTWRTSGLVSLKARTAAQTVAWPASNRIIALGFPSSEDTPGYVINPKTRRVIRRFTLPAGIDSAATTEDGHVAAVLTSFEAIVPARLALMDQEGAVRVVGLPGMRAGSDHRRGRSIRPAVVADGGNVYVVDAERLRIFEIDATTGIRTVHDLTLAHASKGGEGPFRHAQLVAPGLIALSGMTMHGRDAPEYHDLRLVETGSWTVRRIATDVSAYSATRNTLIVWAKGPGPNSRGATAYDLTGRRLWSTLPGSRIVRAETAGNRVFLTTYVPNHATFIHDVRTGKRMKRLPTAMGPILLPGPG